MQLLEHEGAVLVHLGGDVSLDAPFVSALAEACAEVPAEARAVVLDFPSSLWAGYADEAEALAAGDLFGGVAALPMPTVAALHGDVTGGGLELALAADVRVAEADCRFSLDALFGAFPRAGGLQRLSRAVGRARASQLLFLEDAIDADTALRWGLVNAVAASAANEAWRLAQTISQRGPLATRYAKDALQHGAEMPLAQALQYELELTVLLQATADRAEGVAAFTEKRTPQFQGV